MDFIKNLFTKLQKSDISDKTTIKLCNEQTRDDNFLVRNELNTSIQKDFKYPDTNTKYDTATSLKQAESLPEDNNLVSVQTIKPKNFTLTEFEMEIFDNFDNIHEADVNNFKVINNNYSGECLLSSQSVEDFTKYIDAGDIVTDDNNSDLNGSFEIGTPYNENRKVKFEDFDAPIVDLDEIFEDFYEPSIDKNRNATVHSDNWENYNISNVTDLVNEEIDINHSNKNFAVNTKFNELDAPKADDRSSNEKTQYLIEFEKFLTEYEKIHNTKENSYNIIEENDSDELKENMHNNFHTLVCMGQTDIKIQLNKEINEDFDQNEPKLRGIDDMDAFTAQEQIINTKIETVIELNDSIITLSSESEEESDLPLSLVAQISSLKTQQVKNKTNFRAKELDDSLCDSDGYHSSDFEFISENEAELDGLIINYCNKTRTTPKKTSTSTVYTTEISKEKTDTSASRELVEIHLEPVEISSESVETRTASVEINLEPGPSTSNHTNSVLNDMKSKYDYLTLRREFEMKENIKKRERHEIPVGDDYLNLFQGIYAPFPLNVSENKTVGQTRCMNVQPKGLGFDMKAIRQDTEKEKVYEEEANASVKLILEMYPGCNRLRRKRRKHYINF